MHHILKNEIDLILPQLPTKQKCSIITALVSDFIGLTYEAISSFLHNRRQKALHKAVKAMVSKTTIQCNELMHLENSIVIYGIYNTEILGKFINTIHCIHNITTPYEKLFKGQEDTGLLIIVFKNCNRNICSDVQRIYNIIVHIHKCY